MGTEIERKFLVRNRDWKVGRQGQRIYQGYLSSSRACTVRVRLADDQAWLTIKGPSVGITRAEFEYAIPATDAREILKTLCGGSFIDKTRYRIEHAAHVWEVDEFHAANEGLVVAEIELSSERERFEHPDWLGDEVSGDPRYFNSSLIAHPRRKWSDED